MLLGFGYRAGVGKDTVGDYLESRYGWSKYHFADDLKRACSAVFELPMSYFITSSLKNAPLPIPVVITEKDFVGIIDWMQRTLNQPVDISSAVYLQLVNSRIRTPRELLQVVGTDIMRTHVPDYHVLACFSKMSYAHNNVLCDVRFPNEGVAVKDRGGICVNIVRETALRGSSSVHESETAMNGWEGWSFHLDNREDGFDTLYRKVDNLLEDIHGLRRQCS